MIDLAGGSKATTGCDLGKGRWIMFGPGKVEELVMWILSFSIMAFRGGADHWY